MARSGRAGLEPVKPGGRFRTRAANAALMAAALLLVAVASEPLLRIRYAEPTPETSTTVHEVQPWLRLDPEVGFTWLPDVTPDRNVIFHNNDIEPEALSTDEYGVINAPEAIAARRVNARVEVLGFGDSFMEIAAQEFYRAFDKEGLGYYSLAIHRFAPPHYAAMFDAHGLALKPRAVLIGLFENDFAETEDYEQWKRSGLDWFTYHSGTWGGRPVAVNPAKRLAAKYLRGYGGLAKVLRMRLRGERMSVRGPTAHQVQAACGYLGNIVRRANEEAIAVYVVLIPSKPTAHGETTAEARAYDEVADALSRNGARIIDLRPVFQAHADPGSLYYQVDGHWNGAGAAFAAATIVRELSAEGRDSE